MTLKCINGKVYLSICCGWGDVKVKREDLNIMLNVKIIEELKADLLCLIGDFFKQLTKGSNVAQSALLECISRSIIVLYLLAEKLGFSAIEVDEDMKKKLKSGIIEGDSIEKESKALTKLYTHLKERN